MDKKADLSQAQATVRKKASWYVVTTTPEKQEDWAKFQRRFYGPYTIRQEAMGAANGARRNFLTTEVITHTQAKRIYTGTNWVLSLGTKAQLFKRIYPEIIGAKKWNHSDWLHWEKKPEPIA
ncbi:hypothetical protein LCGC14_2903970, partial [marine sediment metagenome]